MSECQKTQEAKKITLTYTQEVEITRQHKIFKSYTSCQADKLWEHLVKEAYKGKLEVDISSEVDLEEYMIDSVKIEYEEALEQPAESVPVVKETSERKDKKTQSKPPALAVKEAAPVNEEALVVLQPVAKPKITLEVLMAHVKAMAPKELAEANAFYKACVLALCAAENQDAPRGRPEQDSNGHQERY